KTLDAVADDAFGVTGLDFAFRSHCELLYRPIRGEGVSDVSERIFVLMQPAIPRHVDAPMGDVLAVVISWRGAQTLDRACPRPPVAISRAMRDTKAHGAVIRSDTAR